MSTGSGVEAGHVLVFHPPTEPRDEHGIGWVLEAYRDGARCWSANLAARGAGVEAGPRVAQAVAVRVLADQGVEVGGWQALTLDMPADAYRAVRNADPGRHRTRRMTGLGRR